MLSDGRLGGRGEDRLRERRVLRHVRREIQAVGGVGPLLEVAPEASGEVAADHDLDREGLRRPGDGDVRVGRVEDVVGDDAPGLLEPELRDAVQHLALERDGGQHAVEGAEPVGRHEEDPVALAVHVAHLAAVAVAERVEVGLGQGVVELSGEDRVRQVGRLSARRPGPPRGRGGRDSPGGRSRRRPRRTAPPRRAPPGARHGGGVPTALRASGRRARRPRVR